MDRLQRPRGRVIIDGEPPSFDEPGQEPAAGGSGWCRGEFAPGDVVRVVMDEGLVARLVNYSSSELVKIKGLSTQKAEELWDTGTTMK